MCPTRVLPERFEHYAAGGHCGGFGHRSLCCSLVACRLVGLVSLAGTRRPLTEPVAVCVM